MLLQCALFKYKTKNLVATCGFLDLMYVWALYIILHTKFKLY